MNFEAEPIIAALVNMLVGLLVSKGIIDSAHAPLLTMDINNILAALVTLGLGGYSIYKTVDAYKHKVTVNAQVVSGSQTTTVVPISTPIAESLKTSIPQQTGLPLTPSNQ